ncbi:hypothetical protein [Cellulomonas bogoriensis]|uniref:ScoMcrA-like N-terminal head domain-containing protein n=1 Tax=Cellulomonas bogoriensis 69B4 = DSM 16987 TaxID=1386082 RepID=A0A0A0BY65_9CELL|nr:hypothetical protein [Cellulomonas bogoriensis]KGM13323.1 hypothetical protein N869_14785 [Cellulomonas bogoriensis 69B4 = DSM 16987]
MATFSSVTRQHLLRALDEHDTRGGDDFLAVYGFTASPDHTVVHDGRRYDARAVMAVAHRHATGRLATPEEFDSSLDAAVMILRRRGFEVTEPQARARVTAPTARREPRRAPARATTPRRTPTREAPQAVCPTCSMTLPATRRCDSCD